MVFCVKSKYIKAERSTPCRYDVKPAGPFSLFGRKASTPLLYVHNCLIAVVASLHASHFISTVAPRSVQGTSCWYLVHFIWYHASVYGCIAQALCPLCCLCQLSLKAINRSYSSSSATSSHPASAHISTPLVTRVIPCHLMAITLYVSSQVQTTMKISSHRPYVGKFLTARPTHVVTAIRRARSSETRTRAAA